jgi:hypothetical protein
MKRETQRRLERLEKPATAEGPPLLVWADPEPKPEGWDTAENRFRIIHEIIDPEPWGEP